MRDFLNNNSCFAFSISQQASVHEAAITAYDVKEFNNDPLTYLITEKGAQTLDVDSFLKDSYPLLPVSGPPNQPSINVDMAKEYNYICYFVGDVLPTESLVGDKEKDHDRGIFHYSVGRDRGIIKNIDLSKTDLEGLKEVRFEQEGYDGLQQLREVYDATITTYANVHAYPGTYLYIDPGGWAPTTQQDLTSLGLGGYYMVITSENTFGPGQAETKMVAKWVASKDGVDRNKIINRTLTKCGAASTTRTTTNSPASEPSTPATPPDTVGTPRGFHPGYFAP